MRRMQKSIQGIARDIVRVPCIGGLKKERVKVLKPDLTPIGI